MRPGAAVLRDGADSHPREATQEAVRAAAQWVEAFAQGAYGPGGGWKLLADEARLVASAAEALRDVPAGSPLAPYKDLAQRVHAEAGDHATLALLWSAGIVRRVLDERPRTAHLRSIIDGLVAARRQCRAWWQAHAAPGDVVSALAGVADVDGATLAAGAERLVRGGELDLDRIDVVAGPVDTACWSEGLRIEPERPIVAEGGVLLVQEAALPKPRTDASLHGSAVDAMAFEDMAADAARTRLQRMGIVLLACRKEIPEALAGRLRRIGIQCISDVPQGLSHRITLATGARQEPHWQAAEQASLGQGRITPRHPRHGGAWLTGDGPIATFEVPEGPMQDLRIEAVERWLRAAGHIWKDPRTLPGGGEWQRLLARHLHGAADHAAGRAGIGMHTAAEALDACVDAMLRNMGLDPRTATLPPMQDAARCVVVAGTAALDLAIDVLRIDAVYRKRPSNQGDLRGGTGPVGSPKGMPGDIPPLM